MNDDEPAPAADSALSGPWLSAVLLARHEPDEHLRSWLQTPGLLTQRMRDTCGAAFRMNVLGERREHGDHVREVELCCAGRAWIYAETRVPAATLAAEPWLAHIGSTALGEALAAHGAVRRPAFEYARQAADVEVVRAALARRGFAAQALWVRRSEFSLGVHRLTLREVFLPDVGKREA